MSGKMHGATLEEIVDGVAELRAENAALIERVAKAEAGAAAQRAEGERAGMELVLQLAERLPFGGGFAADLRRAIAERAP
jgi:hypothetical protein